MIYSILIPTGAGFAVQLLTEATPVVEGDSLVINGESVRFVLTALDSVPPRPKPVFLSRAVVKTPYLLEKREKDPPWWADRHKKYADAPEAAEDKCGVPDVPGGNPVVVHTPIGDFKGYKFPLRSDPPVAGTVLED